MASPKYSFPGLPAETSVMNPRVRSLRAMPYRWSPQQSGEVTRLQQVLYDVDTNLLGVNKQVYLEIIGIALSSNRFKWPVSPIKDYLSDGAKCSHLNMSEYVRLRYSENNDDCLD